MGNRKTIGTFCVSCGTFCEGARFIAPATRKKTVLDAVKSDNGDAVVEAAILLPIIVMIFAALVLLSLYLPTRAALQHATQYAATVTAAQSSDTWLVFDENTMSYGWETDRGRLPFVYVAMFSGGDDVEARCEEVAIKVEERGISSRLGELSVNCQVVNRLVYKELIVTASRVFTVPVNLSIIRFPRTLTITVTSTAVVQNGDEFIRNMDMAVSFLSFINERFGLTDMTDTINSSYRTAAGHLGWSGG